MTGKDLIKFITENRLEEVEVLASPHQDAFQFGNWTMKDAQTPDDTMTYLVGELECRGQFTTEIEAFYFNGATGGTIKLLTPEEALKLRKAI